MNPLDKITIGMTGTKETTVTRELTVGHVIEGMPFVYGTPMMILLMELAAGVAIDHHLPAGWISVGTAVNIRHLAATPLGRTVTETARVIATKPGGIEFAVEAHDGMRKIGDGTHWRGIVDLAAFEKRLGEA